MSPLPDLNPPRFLAVAQILAPFGVRGEVRCRILTDFPKRFARLRTVYIGQEDAPDLPAYALEGFRFHGDQVLLKLGGVNTPEAAAKLRHLLVQIPVSEAMPLPEGQYYHYQVIGLEVFTPQGEFLGRVTEILPTGSNDVYVVRGDQGEILLPAIADVILEVDLANGRMVVELMEGMR